MNFGTYSALPGFSYIRLTNWRKRGWILTFSRLNGYSLNSTARAVQVKLPIRFVRVNLVVQPIALLHAIMIVDAFFSVCLSRIFRSGKLKMGKRQRSRLPYMILNSPIKIGIGTPNILDGEILPAVNAAKNAKSVIAGGVFGDICLDEFFVERVRSIHVQ